ncbi:hypothetical protein L195_g010578 [Trifolium pratense]|uniref:Uncharacterized protein n=1 Tax=Trifolium pratense TaxID=57577 RepID=A0A2K3PF37_TRIPR|nr:hypothetical protein L195_g010578 [Trifolium pratense]
MVPLGFTPLPLESGSFTSMARWVPRRLATMGLRWDVVESSATIVRLMLCALYSLVIQGGFSPNTAESYGLCNACTHIEILWNPVLLS